MTNIIFCYTSISTYSFFDDFQRHFEETHVVEIDKTLTKYKLSLQHMSLQLFETKLLHFS